ncbi:GNAT superfamily N-acetyltransferase [Rhizobium sp. BK650]|uniref:GNAT family N-acetyltransferase n=1 Tax=Rhizobium sp. BK650 TaxID=2586990 RepID=UPI00160ED013|nr:GNAT family N-acetyltransferase [Rhizobium sp. BK650]MBB3657944.1 GNAT superfamily N-acetyltransferase [Rhizobium sp. BK650]
MSISSDGITWEEMIEAKAFIDLARITPQPFKDSVEFTCIPVGKGCAISLPTAPAIGLNRIFALNDRDELNHAFEWMKTKTGRRHVQIREAFATNELHGWILDQGLVESGGWMKLTRPAPSAPLAIEGPVRTRLAGIDDASTFGRLMCAGFGFPAELEPLWSCLVGKKGWACFVAELEGVPIGSGAIFMEEGCGWLGGGTTLAEYRNRGAQKALIDARLNKGLEQGVFRFAVETAQPQEGPPNISFDNLTKAGFKPSYIRKNYTLPN